MSSGVPLRSSEAMRDLQSHSEIEARLRRIEQALSELDAYDVELNSGFANGLRAEDWDRTIEVAPFIEERNALLAERERLREREP